MVEGNDRQTNRLYGWNSISFRRFYKRFLALENVYSHSQACLLCSVDRNRAKATA